MPSSEVRLSREIRLLDITMIGVGAMIGAGIFVLTGIAAGMAGPGLLLAFLLNGFVTLFAAAAGAIKLVELDIAVTIVAGAFLIAFGALALSFVLALGLRSRRAIEWMWEERLRPSRKLREGEAKSKSPSDP